MRIVVSGGWGYGNLGDDAILDATIQALRQRYPGCFIDVLTYDIVDSRLDTDEQVRLHRSLHRSIDFGACEIYYPRISANYSVWSRLVLKTAFALTETRAWFELARRLGGRRDPAAIIVGADLFVMAGGGYLNERWKSKSRCQLLELAVANRLGVPTYILGPTLGRFHGHLGRTIRSQFEKARLVAFRDPFSVAGSGLRPDKVRLIPDIALSTWLDAPPPADGKEIGVIFTSDDAQFRGSLAQAIARFASTHPGWRVTLYVSRMWKPDLVNATELQHQLRRRGVGSSLVLASDFRQLELGLARCRLVVSENLHGLILAARNAVPVIAINNYARDSPNHRKFIAFLSQAASQDMVVDVGSSVDSMLALLRRLDAGHREKASAFRALRADVAARYADLLRGSAQRRPVAADATPAR